MVHRKPVTSLRLVFPDWSAELGGITVPSVGLCLFVSTLPSTAVGALWQSAAGGGGGDGVCLCVSQQTLCCI